MKLPKIEIKQEKSDINLKFYWFLKYIIQSKLTKSQTRDILQAYDLFVKAKNLDVFKQSVLENFSQDEKNSKQNKINQERLDKFLYIFSQTDNLVDVKILAFSLKLYLIKDLLLQEAKSKSNYDLGKLNKLNPLSLEYDKITIFNPYATRVNGALLVSKFFKRLNAENCKNSDNFFMELKRDAKTLRKKGLDINQVFMIVFSEIINQSITNNSGEDYEKRILSVLVGLGIDKDTIKKVHDNADKSTEFDLFFELNGKSYGIGAKRTLRERYKQFIKTAQMTQIDVMIEITLGTDLTQEKAKSITNHGVYLFVADEVYQDNAYLQEMDMVYSCQALSLDLLEKLAK